MYEVRWTMYDLGEFGGYAASLAAGAAYVRWTMYDVRFGEFPRLRASVAEQKRGRNYGATYGRS